jgi:hypothetical protein
MFFADSDATGAYWKGRWDGTPHDDEVERTANGEVVMCAGVRPYMLPTEGWTRHLEEMTDASIEGGADAVLPEEPLAHLHTGYEKAFHALWEERYGTPWRGQDTSQEARYLTGQLKNELYAKLEARLAARVMQRERELGRTIDFLLPIHSLYSNMAGQLVAPLGTSLAIEGVDGYVGQIWTGPVNWARANYDMESTFFASAYALYDYFTELVAGTDRRLWLLVDPVEDDPNHTWAEFEEWYRHCVVAALMMEEVDAYEVMPWPDRIFLPGHNTGGSSPAPEPYRTLILSVMQAMQEMEQGGRWVLGQEGEGEAVPQPTIGVAVADSLMWELEAAPRLGPVYGLLIPLIQAGVPARACVLERMHEPAYRERFDVILLSYEAFKPTSAAMNEHLARWVRDGGALVVYGADDSLDDAALWWKEAGHATPLAHLRALLDVGEKEGPQAVGRGHYLRNMHTPREFSSVDVAERDLWRVIDDVVKASGKPALRRPGYLHMKRGPYVMAHAFSEPLRLTGEFVDVLDPELRTYREMTVQPGQSALIKTVDIDGIPSGGQITKATDSPVIHCTHRLMSWKIETTSYRFTLRGPAETPGVLRVTARMGAYKRITASSADGEEVPLDIEQEGGNCRIRFPNHPEGVSITLRR